MVVTYPNSLAAGSVVHEYCIDAVLGAGSFGITYKATDTHLGMVVAIKEFFPEEYTRRGAQGAVEIVASKYADTYQWELDRFIGEGQVLAAFKHPNIVRVWRYFAANRTAYIVMDYEEGESLKTYLKRFGKPLPETQLRGIFDPVLEGLQEVHSKRYLHRDIKPGNIYIRANNTPLLLDFGAARLEMAKPSESGTSKLTIGYAPIEQYCADSPQGPALDLYALGATMYRCISGQTPVESIKRRTARDKSEDDPLVLATQLGHGCYSHTLLEAIDWMMNLEPQNRPHSAREVLDYLHGGGQAKGVCRIHWQRPSTRDYTVLIAGPNERDNAAALANLSDIPTGRRRSHAATQWRKSEGKKPLDYGLIKLSDSEAVHLYALAGGKSPQLPDEFRQQGLLGVLLLLDDNAPDPLNDLDHVLHTFTLLSLQCKVAIGILNADGETPSEVGKYHRHLSTCPAPWRINPPVFHVNASSSRDMAMLMQALLCSVDPGVQGASVTGSDPATVSEAAALSSSATHRS